MRYIPILFSTPMVKAIMDGSKTQTRRVVKSSTGMFEIEKRNDFPYRVMELDEDGFQTKVVLPKAQINDVFWVRETFQVTDWIHPSNEEWGYIYKASDNGLEWQNSESDWKWKPSIFMPKAVCRNFLKVTNVRIERLHDISEEDAKKEGVLFYDSDFTKERYFKDYASNADGYAEKDYPSVNTAKESFFSLWESINGKASLDDNPFTWVYDFEPIEKPHDFR